MMLYKQVTTTEELDQVLELQFRNLKQHIPLAEKEGFVTLQHSQEVLALMHAIQPSVIAVDKGKVIGYALVMDHACRALVPALEPMFSILDTIELNGKPLLQNRFYVMGQVCIDKAYRGTGVFAALYEKHRELFCQQYDFVVTEISAGNPRSLHAHEKNGFRIIHRHAGAEDEWLVVVWDWASRLS